MIMTMINTITTMDLLIHSPGSDERLVRLDEMSRGMLESDCFAPSDVMSAGVEGAADLLPMCSGWLDCRSSRFRLAPPSSGAW